MFIRYDNQQHKNFIRRTHGLTILVKISLFHADNYSTWASLSN